MKKNYIATVIAVLLTVSAIAQTDFRANNNSNYITSIGGDNASRSKISFIGNPTRGAINIQVNDENVTKYEISLYSMNGRKLSSIQFDHPGGSSTKTIYVNDGAQRGIYYVVAVSKGVQQSLKVLIQ